MTKAIDRRTFLVGAAGAAFAALTGCDDGARTTASRTTGPRPTVVGRTTTTQTVASTTTTVPPPTTLTDLQRGIQGRVLQPTHREYAHAKLLNNTAFDTTQPKAIAQVANAQDVVQCIAFATAHGLPIAVRSGGHSYVGASTGPGIVIDLRALNHVLMHTDGVHANIGPGASLIEVYSTLAAEGRAVPGGSCPTVGFGGLALGGGHGLTGRKFGLTCDVITEIEIVTVDGSIRRASAVELPDLYWACRGGGGRLGIVTEFVVETQPLPAHATTFVLQYDWSDTAAALGQWMQWISTVPDEVSAVARLETHPQLVIAGLHLGGRATTKKLIAPLTPMARRSSVNEQTFIDAMLLEAGCSHRSVEECQTLPRSTPFVAASHYFTASRAPDAIASAMLAINEHAHVDGGGATIQFDAYGGAINRVAPSATAFVHRDAACSAQYASFIGSGQPARHREWIRTTRAAMEPFSNGEAYQNYNDAGLADANSAYFGSNLPRLQAIQRRYDPTKIFA